MQKKVLTINEIFSDNLGDQAIADAMRKFCQVDQNTTVDSVDFSFRSAPQNLKKFNNHKKDMVTWKSFIPPIFKKFFFLFKNLKKVKLIASKKYDLAIIGGGQLILGKRTFPYSLFLYTFFLKKHSTKIKIVSAGVGESFTAFERYLIYKSLERVDSIYLRDSRSMKNLMQNFNQKSLFLPDIAYFLYSELDYDSVKSNFTKSLICPVEYSVYERYSMEMNVIKLSNEQYKKLWVKLIKERLQFLGGICLSGTTVRDFEFSLELEEFFTPEEQKNITFKSCANFQEFVNLAEESTEVLSGRMHALILCHNLNLKILPYEISKKLRSYKKEYLCKEAKEHKKILKNLQLEIIN